ncbi:MAG: prepilin-type N-terminal cleavage/methylation domain-containing protein [Synergistaceae bacterium]|jgi:general secretion pathway protein G|nr:prepilin-type N-terminal cleavage/methylation domain-containing protein [Synergistaceae bacterium]
MVKVRKGFTLVELLIVIVIIGILAGGMMLASGAATATATATTIVSDLKALQGAMVMYYADHMDQGVGTLASQKIYPYMGDSQKIKNDSGTYTFTIDANGWWVTYEGGRLTDAKVQEKVEAKAKDVGLYAAAGASPALYAKGTAKVTLKAR